LKCSSETLSDEDKQLCEDVCAEYVAEARQKPEGILDQNGEYQNFFVWAGAVKKDFPDNSEPGNIMNVHAPYNACSVDNNYFIVYI